MLELEHSGYQTIGISAIASVNQGEAAADAAGEPEATGTCRVICFGLQVVKKKSQLDASGLKQMSRFRHACPALREWALNAQEVDEALLAMIEDEKDLLHLSRECRGLKKWTIKSKHHEHFW